MAEWTCVIRGSRVFLESHSFAAILNRASECGQDRAIIEPASPCCRTAVAGTMAPGGSWCSTCEATGLYPGLPAGGAMDFDAQGREALEEWISWLADPLTAAIWTPHLLRFGASTTNFTSWLRDNRRRAAGADLIGAHAGRNGLDFRVGSDGE